MREEEVAMSGELHDRIEDMKHVIGINIKYNRKIRKMSQQVLSERCNLHRTYISDLENGKCNPTLNVLMVVADQLGISLNTLLGI